MVKMTKFKWMLGIVVLLIAFLAYMDIQGAMFWNLLGGWDSEAYRIGEMQYMKLFWTFALMLGILASVIYFLFRKDLSESLAIFVSYGILVWSGLEDVLFYVFKQIPFEATLPWLNNNLYISTVGKILGQSVVTPTVLILSVISGFLLSYFVVNFLKKQNIKINRMVKI